MDTPLTSLELDFLKEIQEYVDKIFFVINKTDLVSDDVRSEVLRFVTETIQAQTGYNAVGVFPVSARQGLEAKKSGDAVLYEQSGIKALEEALAAFLFSPRGASIGFALLVEQIARRLRENATPEIVDNMRHLVRDSRNCRVCRLLSQVEEEYIRQLAKLIEGTAGRRQYLRSKGVCLQHLTRLLGAVSTREIQESLISHAAQRFEEDAEDMRSYAMKREALRRQLQNRNEEDAYLRAIIRIVGSRNVGMPWAEYREI